MDTIAFDAVRLVHLAGVALGLGLGIYADSRFLRGLGRPILPSRLSELRRIHEHVYLALALLWVSGLVLFAMRTGLDPSLFSVKLLAKFCVVALLTVNAMAIGAIALPLLELSVEKRFCDLSRPRRLILGLIGGISCASWGLALALGVFTAAKEMSGGMLLVFLGSGYALGLTVGAVIAFGAPFFAVLRDSGPVGLRDLSGLASPSR
ncbi:MAG: hypothetical protein AAFR46_15095 [Pseudomonadota bacterium]